MKEKTQGILYAIIFIPPTLAFWLWAFSLAYQGSPVRFMVGFFVAFVFVFYYFWKQIELPPWREIKIVPLVKYAMVIAIMAAFCGNIAGFMLAIIGSWDRAECAPGVPGSYC